MVRRIGSVGGGCRSVLLRLWNGSKGWGCRDRRIILEYRGVFELERVNCIDGDIGLNFVWCLRRTSCRIFFGSCRDSALVWCRPNSKFRISRANASICFWWSIWGLGRCFTSRTTPELLKNY